MANLRHEQQADLGPGGDSSVTSRCRAAADQEANAGPEWTTY